MITDLRPFDPTSVGPYRLLGRLGEGGMGHVYLARSQGGRLVAVKVIRPELAQEHGFRTRFAREIAAAKNVSGMYTAAVVDSDPEAELPWMATVYVAGPSLADAVHDGGPLPVRSVLALAAGLAEALAGIHGAGVVHRDLKPSNVLLAADGPRVIDFGISQAVERSVLTATGVVLGSPGYMSPEQARGLQGEVGKPTDVFSLGAVLAFAATGTGPFGSGPTPALLYRVVNEGPDLAQVPARLRPLIERCLAKDPASRPAPSEVLRMLDDDGDAPTGEWLPKTVVDAIGRFSPPSETPTRSPLATLPWPEPAAGPAASVTGPAGGGEPVQPPAGSVGRLRKWRWPLSAAAVVIAVVVPTTIFATSSGGTPKSPGTTPAASPDGTPTTTGTTLAASPRRTATTARTSFPALPGGNPATKGVYVSAPLATGSRSVTARVYFGQLAALGGALADLITLNTEASWFAQEPGRCALTVVFGGIAEPKGVVGALGLGSGWAALENAPIQDTENGTLHQQIVTPPDGLNDGSSWQGSAVLIVGSQQLTTGTYSLEYQGSSGSVQTWLVDGQTVSCSSS